MNPMKDIPNNFKRTSSLSHDDIAMARKILEGKQPFSIYLNAAIEDLKNGNNNRWFHFSSAGGLIMGIDFDELRVISIIGDVEDEMLFIIAKNPMRTEFHLTKKYADRLLDIGKDRLLREHHLKYYLLNQEKPFCENLNGLRPLSKSDISLVERFYSNNYDGTIFSSWMLEQPFWGLFIGENLIAAGGAIAVDKFGLAANIGNFLTAPQYRGRGYGKVVTRKLIDDLMRIGIKTFTLGTTEENIPAWKTYESVGFQLLEKRVEIEFSSILRHGNKI
ncbi:MAG: GNAT family N-acetyltransferase [Bdellovibrionota bacterium]